MIHPDIIGTRALVFDMDGTLIRSGRLAVTALRRSLQAFYEARGETPPAYTDQQLTAGIGAPSDVFYRSLLNETELDHWRDFREQVFTAEADLLATERITFPGALKTLDMLLDRGYRIALVSNCNTPYLQTVLRTQGLGKRFETAVCIGDQDGATKSSLIADLLDTLGERPVVIGDRHYDMEAAKANGLPSVGCLYGYGERDELSNSTAWVEDVRQLAYLFNPVRELAARIATRIDRLRPQERPFVIALDTPHPALSWPLSEHLIRELVDRNVPTQHLRMLEHQDTSRTEVRDAFPWPILSQDILNARHSGRIETEIPVRRDFAREAASGRRPLRVRNGQVLIVEGPYLLGDWLDGAAYDSVIRIDARPAAVNRVLRSQATFRRHAEVAGASTLPDWTTGLPEMKQQWEKTDRKAWTDYNRMISRNSTLEIDVVLDGNRLARGTMIRESWRDERS